MPEALRVAPGDRVTDDIVQYVYDGLRACDLPATSWTHGGHLCAGVALLRDVGLSDAEAVMPGLIRKYNVATGGENTDTAGYHHTITLFYLRVIATLFEGRWEEPLGELATDMLLRPESDREFPLTYYSKDFLFSVDARRAWRPPDLKPFFWPVSDQPPAG